VRFAAIAAPVFARLRAYVTSFGDSSKRKAARGEEKKPAPVDGQQNCQHADEALRVDRLDADQLDVRHVQLHVAAVRFRVLLYLADRFDDALCDRRLDRKGVVVSVFA
jgi:hypothetical protein